MVATKLQFCLQTHAQVFGTSMPRAVEVAFFVPRSASASAFGSAPPPSLNVALRCTESFSRPPSNSLDQNLKFRAPQSRLMYKTTHDYNTRGCSK